MTPYTSTPNNSDSQKFGGNKDELRRSASQDYMGLPIYINFLDDFSSVENLESRILWHVQGGEHGDFSHKNYKKVAQDMFDFAVKHWGADKW